MGKLMSKSNQKLADTKMRKIISVADTKPVSRTLSTAVIAISCLLNACGSADNSLSETRVPDKPAQYQSDTTAEIAGLRAYYDFEGSLVDSTNLIGDAEPVGNHSGLRNFGTIGFDGFNGIHELSATALFDEHSGLLLPNGAITGDAFTVSMWVNPDPGSSMTLFFMENEGGTLALDASGLRVTGNTGMGISGDEPVTYTSDDFVIRPSEWTHVVFTVDEGLVNIYLNGRRVYEQGDLVGNNTAFGDWIMEIDAFANRFAGPGNTITLGVTNDVVGVPFAGKIDKLRIYDSALYFGNVRVLSEEVSSEGPTASVTAVRNDADVNISWSIERYPTESINVYRSAYLSEERLLIAEGLDGEESGFVDLAVTVGENYQYNIEFVDAKNHTMLRSSEFVRVPGTEPYAAVSALLNEETNNIELGFYTENIDVASYEVLRDITDVIDNATVIATGLTDNSLIDFRNKLSDENPNGDLFPLSDGTTYTYWIRVTDTESAVVTSLALPAASATTEGEATPVGTLILEENADGYCGLDGVIESNHIGFTGTGFSNTDNAVGTAIRWKINVFEAGTYNLTITYASGSVDNRWGIITANGEDLVEEFDLELTGEPNVWTVYESITEVVDLPAGEVDLAMIAGTNLGLANLDSLAVSVRSEEGTPPEPVACAE